MSPVVNISEWTPYPPPGPVGEQAGDDRRDRADAGLERRPVGDVTPGLLGDGQVDVGAGGLGEVDGLRIGFHEDVDLVDVQPVRVVGLHPEGAGERLGVLGDQDAVRVGSAAMELVDGRPGVEGEAEVAVVVRRCHGGGHDVRCQRLDDRPESSEVGGDVGDVGAAVAEEPLRRAVEAAPVVDARHG